MQSNEVLSQAIGCERVDHGWHQLSEAGEKLKSREGGWRSHLAPGHPADRVSNPDNGQVVVGVTEFSDQQNRRDGDGGGGDNGKRGFHIPSNTALRGKSCNEQVTAAVGCWQGNQRLTAFVRRAGDCRPTNQLRCGLESAPAGWHKAA